LACYPREHRDAYGDEMLGVLLAAADPGRTRPTLVETLDLLRGALRYRLHRGSRETAGRPWRQVVSAVTVIILFTGLAAGCSSLVRMIRLSRRTDLPQLDLPEHLDPTNPQIWLALAYWLVILVVAIAVSRRAAAALAWAATAYGVTGLVFYPAAVWPQSLSEFVVLALLLSFGAHRRLRSLGWHRLALLAGFGVLIVFRTPGSADPFVGLVPLPLAVATFACSALLLRRGASRRQQVFAVVAPLVIILQPRDWSPLVDPAGATPTSASVALAQFVLLLVVPVATFVAAAVLVRRAGQRVDGGGATESRAAGRSGHTF
jgi:hypothetical protein